MGGHRNIRLCDKSLPRRGGPMCPLLRKTRFITQSDIAVPVHPKGDITRIIKTIYLLTNWSNDPNVYPISFHFVNIPSSTSAFV